VFQGIRTFELVPRQNLDTCLSNNYLRALVAFGTNYVNIRNAEISKFYFSQKKFVKKNEIFFGIFMNFFQNGVFKFIYLFIYLFDKHVFQTCPILLQLILQFSL